MIKFGHARIGRDLILELWVSDLVFGSVVLVVYSLGILKA